MAQTNYGIKKAINFGDFDVLIICVSTHRPDNMFSPQIDSLLSVMEKISREAKTGALISIESTIPKGTSKKVFEKVDHRLNVVHATHRWYALEENIHGVNQLRIIGGVSSCCLQHGLNFYDGNEIGLSGGNDSNNPKKVSLTSTSSSSSSIKVDMHSLQIPMHPVSSIEVAELTKIIENAHRYLQIAFAEELYLYCRQTTSALPNCDIT